MIHSQRSFYGFYLRLFGWCSFYFIMAWFTGEIFFYKYNSTLFEARNYGLIPLWTFLTAGAIYTIYKYFKVAPVIELDRESITFNHSSTYFWKDLEKAELTGKRPYLFLTEREGVSLKFKDHKERLFLDKMYENSPEMKIFIDSIISEKSNSIEPVVGTHLPDSPNEIHIPTDDVKTENADDYLEATPGEERVSTEENGFGQIKYFRGSPLFCFQGIILWGLITLFWVISVLSLLKNSHMESWIGPLILSALFFTFLSRRFYYFGVSNNKLFVKSHYFFWIKNVYPLDDIKEIVFEQPGRMPVTLRIINKDFTTAKYPAASLWSRTWMQLKTQLEQKNIKVRNECVSYEPFEFKLFND